MRNHFANNWHRYSLGASYATTAGLAYLSNKYKGRNLAGNPMPSIKKAHKASKAVKKMTGRIGRKVLRKVKKKIMFQWHKKARGALRTHHLNVDPENIHSGITIKHVALTPFAKTPFNKKHKHVGRIKLIDNYQTVMTSNEGQQALSLINEVLSVNNFYLASASSAASTSGALFQLDQNAWRTGSNIYATGSEFQSHALRIYDLHLDIFLANNTSLGAFVELYFVTPKQTTNRTFSDIWTDALTQEGQGVTANNPATEGVVPTAGRPTQSTLMVRPEHFKEVTKYYHILKKKHYILDAGAQMRNNVVINYNKVYYNDVLQKLSNDGTKYARGLNLQVWCLQYGSVIEDDNGTTDYGPSLCSTRIQCVVTRTINMCALSLENQARNVYGETNIVTGSATSKQKQINMVDATANLQQAA